MESGEGEKSISILLRSKTLRKHRKEEYLTYLLLYLCEKSKSRSDLEKIFYEIMKILNEVSRNNCNAGEIIEKLVDKAKTYSIDYDLFGN